MAGIKFHSMVAIGVVIILTASCSPDSGVSSKPIAKVNNFVITAADFKERIVANMEIYGGDALTMQDKKRYLDREIDKELLIQAAIDQGLERDPKFRAAIQRFWEQSLITALFESKADEIARQVIVTEQEVVQRHKEQCAKDPDCPPLDQDRKALQRDILDEKKKKALDAWLSEVRKRASVKIYEDNLKSMR